MKYLLLVLMMCGFVYAEETSKVVVIDGCEYLKTKEDKVYMYKHMSGCTNTFHIYKMPMTLR